MTSAQWRRLGISIATIPATAQSDCPSAKEALESAQQKLHPGISTQEAATLLVDLEHASKVCRSDGVSWYYRGPTEKFLRKSPADYQYSFQKAKEFHSAAMAEGRDPFAAGA